MKVLFKKQFLFLLLIFILCSLGFASSTTSTSSNLFGSFFKFLNEIKLLVRVVAGVIAFVLIIWIIFDWLQQNDMKMIISKLIGLVFAIVITFNADSIISFVGGSEIKKEIIENSKLFNEKQKKIDLGKLEITNEKIKIYRKK